MNLPRLPLPKLPQILPAGHGLAQLAEIPLPPPPPMDRSIRPHEMPPPVPPPGVAGLPEIRRLRTFTGDDELGRVEPRPPRRVPPQPPRPPGGPPPKHAYVLARRDAAPGNDVVARPPPPPPLDTGPRPPATLPPPGRAYRVMDAWQEPAQRSVGEPPKALADEVVVGQIQESKRQPKMIP